MKRLYRVYKTNKKLFTDLFITTIFGVVASFTNYLFNVAMARDLPEEDFAIFSAVVALLYLILVTTTTLQSAVTKLVAKHRHENLSQFKKALFKQLNTYALVVAVFFVFASPVVSSLFHIPLRYTILLAPVSYGSIMIPNTQGLLFGLQKVKLANFLAMVSNILKFLIGVFFVRFIAGPTVPILVFSIPFMFVAFVVWPFIKFDPQSELPKKPLKLSLKSVFHITLGYLLFNFGQAFATLLVNPSNRASYSSVTILGRIVFFGATIVATAMFANIAKEKTRKAQQKMFLLVVSLTGIVVLTISAGYFFAADLVVSIVFGGKYTEIAPYVGMIGLSMGLYAVAYMILNYLIIRDQKEHIYWLLALIVLQTLLFLLRNDTLADAITNQVVVYTAYFFVFTYLLVKEGRGERLDLGSELVPPG